MKSAHTIEFLLKKSRCKSLSKSSRRTRIINNLFIYRHYSSNWNTCKHTNRYLKHTDKQTHFKTPTDILEQPTCQTEWLQ